MRATLVLLSLAMAGCGSCKVNSKPPTPDHCAPDLPPDDDGTSLEVRTGDPCSSPKCGGNSPVINGFPINGLHMKGCRNLEGFALTPKGTTVPAPPEPRKSGSSCAGGKGYTLGRDDDGWLSATRGDKETCTADELIGATIAVDRWTAARGRERKHLTIADMAMIPTQLGGFPAYRFTARGTSQPSLCRPAAAKAWLESSPAMPGVTGASLTSDYAVITGGPIFNERGRPIKNSYRPTPTGDSVETDLEKWFNIACADDALAKVRLHVVKPPSQTSLASERYVGSDGWQRGVTLIADFIGPPERIASLESQRAALHMLTANYCQSTHHYTVKGIDIEWKPEERQAVLATGEEADGGVANESAGSTSARASVTVESDRATKQLEARWGPEGATCANASRLWSEDVLVPPAAIPGGCLDKNCSETTFLGVVSAECRSLAEVPPSGDEATHPVIPRCPKDAPAQDAGVYWQSTVKAHLPDE